MKKYYSTKSHLSKFSVKTEECTLERLTYITDIRKDNYIKKYLFDKYVAKYDICNEHTVKYTLIIKYKPINNYSNCILINNLTEEQIDFVSKNRSLYSIKAKINSLIEELENDIREKELYRILRIKAYEVAHTRH